MFLIKEEGFTLDLRGFKKIYFSHFLSKLFDFYCISNHMPFFPAEKRIQLSKKFDQHPGKMSHILYKLTNKKLSLFKISNFLVTNAIFQTLELDVLASFNNLALVKVPESPIIYSICFQDNKKILMSLNIEEYGSIICQSL